jgi:predicted phage terminase large subunit-like protein
MTRLPTSSALFELNYKQQVAKSGLRNRPPATLPIYWAPSSTGLFDFSPASDQPTQTQDFRNQTEQTTYAPTVTLLDFIQSAWSILEPSTPYQHNWHIEVITAHLEAISRGELQDLLINVPPGFMKSLTVSVFWPAWEWTWKPWTRWLFNSYDSALSLRDAVKTRRLIQSDWYQKQWGSRFKLTSDQNVKGRYENDRTGWRIASSVNGGNTGEHAHRRVVDDPHNVQEAESDADRQNVLEWWKETMSSRGIPTSDLNARVMVMQRVHHQDVAQDWLEREPHVHHISLPNEYEGTDASKSRCAWAEHDQRRNDGELLWPAMVAADEALRLKTTKLGPYAYAGQYQQRPTPRSGLILDPNWFTELPSHVQLRTWKRVLYFDTAESEKQTADYTAGVLLFVEPDVDEPRMHIGGLFHQRVGEERLDVELAECIAMWRPDAVGIEDRAFKQQAIKMLVTRVRHALRNEYGLTTIPIESVPIDTDKVYRARMVEAPAKAGLISTEKRQPWWPILSGEMTTFPLGAHDDTIDALSGAVAMAYRITALLRMRDALKHPSEMRVRSGMSLHKAPSELEQMLARAR